MATPDEIARVREYISEPDDTNGWTVQRIGPYIDEASSLYSAAADIWGVKASAYAGLVDVSESGSSRALGQLRENAFEMERYYRDKAEKKAGAGAPFSVPIRRRT